MPAESQVDRVSCGDDAVEVRKLLSDRLGDERHPTGREEDLPIVTVDVNRGRVHLREDAIEIAQHTCLDQELTLFQDLVHAECLHREAVPVCGDHLHLASTDDDIHTGQAETRRLVRLERGECRLLEAAMELLHIDRTDALLREGRNLRIILHRQGGKIEQCLAAAQLYNRPIILGALHGDAIVLRKVIGNLGEDRPVQND